MVNLFETATIVSIAAVVLFFMWHIAMYMAERGGATTKHRGNAKPRGERRSGGGGASNGGYYNAPPPVHTGISPEQTIAMPLPQPGQAQALLQPGIVPPPQYPPQPSSPVPMGSALPMTQQYAGQPSPQTQLPPNGIPAPSDPRASQAGPAGFQTQLRQPQDLFHQHQFIKNAPVESAASVAPQMAQNLGVQDQTGIMAFDGECGEMGCPIDNTSPVA